MQKRAGGLEPGAALRTDFRQCHGTQADQTKWVPIGFLTCLSSISLG